MPSEKVDGMIPSFAEKIVPFVPSALSYALQELFTKSVTVSFITNTAE